MVNIYKYTNSSHGSIIFSFRNIVKNIRFSNGSRHTNFYAHGSVINIRIGLIGLMFIVFIDNENICIDTDFVAIPFLVYKILSKV